jgi:hypothetical protein
MMARAPESPAEVFIRDEATGKLHPLTPRLVSGRHKCWEYSNKNDKDIVTLTRNTETDRIDISVSDSFTGTIRVPMRDIMDHQVPGAYDTLTFKDGQQIKNKKPISHTAISQVGAIKSTSVPLSGLGALKPTFTPSPLNAHASRHFKTDRSSF